MNIFSNFLPESLIENSINKKIFLGIGFLIFVIIAGYGIYSVFFKPSLTPSEKETEIATSTDFAGGLPESETGQGQITENIEGGALSDAPGEYADAIARGGITQTSELSQTSVLDANLSGNNSNLRYYNPEDGKFYTINQAGETTLLTDKIFNNVEKVTWSPAKNSAILEYPDGANIIYDFSLNKQTTLPAHWKDFDFSPDGNKIIMKSLGLDTSNRWIAVANEDGSQAVAIEPIGEKDSTIYPSWSPNNQIVAMYTEGISLDRQEVFFLGLNDENFKSTIIEGRGFTPKWSPEGDKLLYSVYSPKTDLKPTLWVVSADGDNIGEGRKSLNLETWADKCVFDNNNTVYCAAPRELEEGAGLFPELSKISSDQLYSIDLLTGSKKLVAIPNGKYNMTDLILGDNASYLYFTDDTTKKIYKINLK